MALPTVQSVSTFTHGTTGATAPTPASFAANDILLVCCKNKNIETATLGTANGFVETASSPSEAAVAGGPHMTTFWKRATGAADAMPVINDPGDHLGVFTVAFRGCITAGNPWNISTSGNEATNDTSLSAPFTGPTTADNCLIVYVLGASGDTAVTRLDTGQTNANLGSLTEQADFGMTDGVGGWAGMVTGTLATAGAPGTLTATLANTGYKAWIIFALQGAASAPSGFLDGRGAHVSFYSRAITSTEVGTLWAVGSAATVFNLEQTTFLLRNDDGTEVTATQKAPQNTNISALRDANIRVRFEMQETGNASGASTFQLQYSKNGGAFANVTAASTNVRSSASPNVADGAATTDQLTLGTGTFAAGSFDEVDGAVASVTMTPRGHTELEFCVQIRSADVAVGDTIQLQLTASGDASVTYTKVPTLTVQGALAQLEQKAFRLRNDDGDEAGASWKATQNTNASAFLDTNLRLRFEMQETAAGSGVVSYQLQYNKNAAGYLNVDASASAVRPALSPQLSDDTSLTNQLTTGTGTFCSGRFDEVDGIASGDPLVASGHTEVEYCVQMRSASVSISDTIAFRLVPSGDVTGATTYTQTPTVTAVGLPPPSIVSFTPLAGVEGAQQVVITGSNFTAITSVTFNSVSAAYVVDSTTQITAVCPLGATTGKIRVINANGTAVSALDFTVSAAPPPITPAPPAASSGFRDEDYGGGGGDTTATSIAGTTPASRDSHWGGG